MTDNDDSTAPAPAPDGQPPVEAPITRYSKETLLALRDSSLVVKPETMPPLSAWFGEEYAFATDKILNGAGPIFSAGSLDKNMATGSSKSGFTSSSFNGLKRPEDTNSSKHTPSTRHRQQPDALRSKDNRAPRSSPHSGEKGPSRRERADRHHSELPSRGRQNGSRSTRTDDPRGIQHSRNEQLPEWMDYNPDEAPDITRDSQDLEAWKSSMKQKEHEASLGNSVDSLQAMGSLQIDPHRQLQEQPPHPSGGLPDPMLNKSQSNTGGSRFAKFFANKEEHPQPSSQHAPTNHLQHMLSQPSLQQQPNPSPTQYRQHPQPPPSQQQLQQQHYLHQQSMHLQQPKSISLSDLFQGDMHHQPHLPTKTFPSQRPGMLFEEDILKSHGAARPVSREQAPADNAGFDRVLQILSQSKPSVHSQKNDMAFNHPHQQDLASRGIPVSMQDDQRAGSAPPGLGACQSLKSESGSPSVKHKSVNNLLPTSVMRRMSARPGSRSPSNSSVKSTGSGRLSGSPALSNYSPLDEKANVPFRGQRPLHAEPPMPLEAFRDMNEYPPYLPSSYGAPNGLARPNGDDPRLARMQHPSFPPPIDPQFMPPQMMLPPDAGPMLSPHGLPPQFQGQPSFPMSYMMNNAMPPQMFASNDQQHAAWNMRP